MTTVPHVTAWAGRTKYTVRQLYETYYFEQNRSAIYEAMHAIHVTNLHL